MTFEEYVKGIRFTFLQPDMSWKGEEWQKGLNEEVNTQLPENDAEMKQRLVGLCAIPRMSTLANAAIINHGTSCLSEGSCYLNIGVWNGFSFLAGMVGNPTKDCIGVDNFSLQTYGNPEKPFLARFNEMKSEKHQFFNIDSTKYLKTVHTMPIGFYFYDGDHKYYNQRNGLELAEPFFTKDCIVMVDDTNWPAPRDATLDFIKKSPNKYRILLDQTTAGDGGHPTFWNGIIVFQRTSIS